MSTDKNVEQALNQRAKERRVVAEAQRKPFGAMRQRGAYQKKEGFHLHWFNDEPGRIERALEAGYKHVKNPATGDNIVQPAGIASTGGVLNRYLMEIPLEFWLADRKALQDEIDRREAAYKEGIDAHGSVGHDGRYVPATGIRIKTNRQS